MNRRSWLWLLGVAILARFLCSAVDMRTWADSAAYLQSAKALLSGHWSDFQIERTPGYPLFLILHIMTLRIFGGLAADQAVFNATGWTQALLGIGTACLSADIAFRLFRQPALAFVVGLLTALAPDLLFYEHTALSETLYAFSLVLALWWAIRVGPNARPLQWLLLGCLAAWLVWVRPIGLIFVFSLGWLFVQKKAGRGAWLSFLVPVAVFCGLWAGFQAKYHHYWGLNPGGGLNQLYKTVEFVRMQSPLRADFKQDLSQRMALYPVGRRYEAVNDVHVLHQMGRPDQASWQVYLDDDRAAGAVSLEAVAARPGLYLFVTGREMVKMLSEATDWDSGRLFWIPLLLLGTVGSLLLWRESPWGGRLLLLALWGQMLAYPLLTLVIARYRVPLEPLLMIPAVYGAFRLQAAFREMSTGPVSAESVHLADTDPKT